MLQHANVKTLQSSHTALFSVTATSVHAHQYLLLCVLLCILCIYPDLVQEYNQAIGATFLELNQAGSPTALQRMQQLTTEALVLAGRAMLVPGMHQAVMNGRLDTGGPTLQKPDTAWYQRLLVLHLLSERISFCNFT